MSGGPAARLGAKILAAFRKGNFIPGLDCRNSAKIEIVLSANLSAVLDIVKDASKTSKYTNRINPSLLIQCNMNPIQSSM